MITRDGPTGKWRIGDGPARYDSFADAAAAMPSALGNRGRNPTTTITPTTRRQAPASVAPPADGGRREGGSDA